MCSLGGNLGRSRAEAWEVLRYSASHWKPDCRKARSLIASSFARAGSLRRLPIDESSIVPLCISPYLAQHGRDAKELSDANVKVLRQAGKLYNLGDRILRKGLSGEDVRELQRYLQSTGHFNSPDGCTGYFGFQTQAAVQDWQSDHGVLPTGIFGRHSRQAYRQLLTIEAQKMRSPKRFLAWLSTDKASPASVSQQLHRSTLSMSSIQGFMHHNYALLVLASTLALSYQLFKTLLRQVQADKLQLQDQLHERDMPRS